MCVQFGRASLFEADSTCTPHRTKLLQPSLWRLIRYFAHQHSILTAQCLEFLIRTYSDHHACYYAPIATICNVAFDSFLITQSLEEISAGEIASIVPQQLPASAFQCLSLIILLLLSSFNIYIYMYIIYILYIYNYILVYYTFLIIYHISIVAWSQLSTVCFFSVFGKALASGAHACIASGAHSCIASGACCN